MSLAFDQQIPQHIWCPGYLVETSQLDQPETLAGLVGVQCRSFDRQTPGQESHCVELRALHSKGECQRVVWLSDPLLPLMPTFSDLSLSGEQNKLNDENRYFFLG